MAIRTALGLVETAGLTAAIEFADAALKAANVKLLGYELTNGFGWVTVKITGDVAAVQAAVNAGTAAASRVGRVVSQKVIPRPHQELEKLIDTPATVNAEKSKPVADKTSQGPPNHEEPAPIIETEGESDENQTPPVADGEAVPDEYPPASEDDVDEAQDDAQAELEPSDDIKGESEDSDQVEGNPSVDDEPAAAEETEEPKEPELPKKATCNICNDPACPRVKGEPRTLCIHHKP